MKDAYLYRCDYCGKEKLVSGLEVRAMLYPFSTVTCCRRPMARSKL
jgi:hypothetical protein